MKLLILKKLLYLFFLFGTVFFLHAEGNYDSKFKSYSLDLTSRNMGDPASIVNTLIYTQTSDNRKFIAWNEAAMSKKKSDRKMKSFHISELDAQFQIIKNYPNVLYFMRIDYNGTDYAAYYQIKKNFATSDKKKDIPHIQSIFLLKL